MKNNKIKPTTLVFDLCGVIFDCDVTNAHQEKLFTPLEPGMHILEQCAQHKNKSNSPLQKIYAFSNVSEQSYNNMKSYYPHIFACFDEVVASFQTGYKKPDAKAFYNFLHLHNLQPEACIFIDDKEANVLAARAIGMHGIVYNDYVQVKEQLNQLGII